jgi:hypothetical protein
MEISLNFIANVVVMLVNFVILSASIIVSMVRAVVIMDAEEEYTTTRLKNYVSCKTLK